MNNVYIDSESVINKDFFENVKEMLTCCICTGVLVDPMQCSSCENCFCRSCIENWIKKAHTCPYKCSSPRIKEGGRMVKNLLEKLIFKCENECGAVNLTYKKKIEHIKQCVKRSLICENCGSEYNERKNRIKIDLKKELQNKYEKMRKEMQILLEEKQRLKDKIKKIKNSTHNNSNSISNLLIDKCNHFYGNYKPIFICCNEAYPCYQCHDENQFHHYEFSNKVLCLICGNIYKGNTCNVCNTSQIYKKK